MKQITLQKQILDRIKAQHVKPTPKGYFKMRDYVMWGLIALFAAALCVGASMVIFMVMSTDRTTLAKLRLPLPKELFYSVPVFWILATIAIAGVVYFNFRRTRRGYRISRTQFTVTAVIVAGAFGSLFYAFNVSKYIDTEAIQNIPLYSSVEPFNTNSWFDPDDGLLSGAVKIKTSDGNFTLRDQNFDLWTVTGSDVTMSPPDFTFQSGDHVKIIGKKIGNLQFEAYEIRPFDTEIVKQQATTSGPLQ